MNLLNYLFEYVILTSKDFNIDDSHSLSHSINVLDYASRIYQSEIETNPYLVFKKYIIYTSAIIHDMCDKKYMNETEGVERIQNELIDNEIKYGLSKNDIDSIIKIISTMSYSTVKIKGYPTDLNENQMAYHIVREADLLCSYDIDRCIVYQMMKNKDTYTNSISVALDLFEHRVLKYIEDGLFITDFSKRESQVLHNMALQRIQCIKQMIRLK
jgi:HD superfamily phosphodiesterase